MATPLLPATRANVQKAMYDYWTFIDIIGFQGGSSLFGEVHHELVEFLTNVHYEGYEDENRRLVLMPRGHLKSTLGCVGYTLWRIFRNPNIRILVGTNILPLANAFIRELRQWLESPELKERLWNNSAVYDHAPLVPAMDRGKRGRASVNEDEDTDASDKKIIWNNSALQVLRDVKAKEPTVYTVSVGTKVTGQHYDLLILDDIVDFDNTSSTAKIEKVFEWAQDLESVLDPRHICPYTDEYIGDEIIINGTRYADGDYYDYLLENVDELGYVTFIRNIYYNGLDDDEGYLWPEKFNAKVVQRLRSRLTSRRFASQYLNSIITEDGSVLDFDKLQYISPANIKCNNGVAEISRLGGVNVTCRLYMTVDPAVSQSKGADNTSIAVGGVSELGELYIVDGVAGKLTPQKIVEEIFRLAAKWQMATVYVEVVGWQGALIHYIREGFIRHQVLNVIPWTPQGKGKKKERIEYFLQPVFNQEMIYVPTWMKQWNILIAELADGFTSGNGHDDVLDTWTMIKEIAKPFRTETKARARKSRRKFNTKWGGSY